MTKTRVKRLYNSPSGGKIPNNLRLDGTKKGKGFAQIRKPNQPRTMTEYSIGRPGGKGGDTYRPAITKNINPIEANYIQVTGKVSVSQQIASLKQAKKRISQGKDVFYNQKDDALSKYKKGK